MILSHTIRNFSAARDGNVLITFALASVPIMFVLGATADYGYAVKSRAQMNAAADAAALSGVTPEMMKGSFATAVTRATAVFNAQASNLNRVTYDPANLRVGAGANDGDRVVNNKLTRTLTVTYTATSQNAFAGVLNMNTITIGGTSTATAATSPNIDFYLMLDTSPSMAIPATQAGIDWMVANTPYQDGGTASKHIGCAFACHETMPERESGSSRTNPIFGNPGCPDDPLNRKVACMDNYALARSATLDDGSKIVLRMDLVAQAVSNLNDTAKDTATKTGAAYRLAGYTFDRAVALPMPLQVPSDTAKQQASTIQTMTVPYENTYFDASNNVVYNSDQDTDFDLAFGRLKTDMTNAGVGNGTNAANDKPQQVLMIVTDGVSDEPWRGNRIYNPLGGTTNTVANSTQTCTDFKANANVRIAVLYLTYNPMPLKNGSGGATWYAGNVAPFQNDIAPTLRNCASPGLFYQVDTGGDVSAAMATLFQQALKSARLSF